MIRIEIPGIEEINIDHVVFDVNGTLAVDGSLLPDVDSLLIELGERVNIHLLTADTHGKQAEIDRQLGMTATRMKAGKEAEQKAAFLKKLGGDRSAAIGQGANDSLMLKEARIGICVLSEEGAAVETLLQADLVAPDIISALSLLIHPTRLVASLRK
ncbi:MAG: HAD family hydrolase [Anaerolineales bacterium]|nr:HAD family hydrolase [Anaerolineales bacterium]